MADQDYTFPPKPPWPGPGPGPIPPDDFWNCYRGRYSQYWATRFGLIPALPTNFDNANDIYELLAWLQRGFKTLLDDFANLELEFEEFKNAIIEMLEIIIPQLIRQFIYSKEFHDYIFELIWEWWYLYQEDRILNIEKEIIKIWNEINLIWININQIQDVVFEANYIELRPGIDYDLGFFNGYHNDDTNLPYKVSVIDTFDRYLIRVEFQRLQNPSVANMIQNHGASVEDSPESAIFGINFKGEWVDINSAQRVEEIYNSASTALFNIYPKDERATWQPFFRIFRDYGGYEFVNTFRSLADGYNTQYNEYLSPTSKYNLDYGAFVYQITAIKPPEE